MPTTYGTTVAHPDILSSGVSLIGRQSKVLENRDLCRIVTSYIPLRMMPGMNFIHFFCTLLRFLIIASKYIWKKTKKLWYGCVYIYLLKLSSRSLEFDFTTTVSLFSFMPSFHLGTVYRYICYSNSLVYYSKNTNKYTTILLTTMIDVSSSSTYLSNKYQSPRNYFTAKWLLTDNKVINFICLKFLFILYSSISLNLIIEFTLLGYVWLLKSKL